MSAGAPTISAPDSLASAGALFLVWGPPSHGPRSRVFARELGIDAVFLRSSRRRGALTAPLRYGSYSVRTLSLLLRRRPRVVFVQSPPSPAVAVVWLYCRVAGARFVVDAHSDAMLSPYWTRPRWLVRFLARRALATVVTNEHFARRIRKEGGTALVIRDVPTTPSQGEPFPVEGPFNVMVVSSFAPDEPIAELIAAAGSLEGVRFYVTGDPARAPQRLPAEIPANVRLTGFLSDAAYVGLMRSCQAVVCLTTHDHTMQRGACEALSMGRPVVTSDWPILREYFAEGAVHVDGTAEAIRAGLEEMVRNHARYTDEIERLSSVRRGEWRAARRRLLSLVDGVPDLADVQKER